MNSCFIYRLERSKVRVSFFQSGKPQQISPTELQQIGFFETEQALLNDYSITDTIFNEDNKMATATALPTNYDRQIRYAINSKLQNFKTKICKKKK